jgi:predicted small secreted protein
MKILLIVFLALALLLFSGCSTAYGTGKVVYKGARTAYIELELENENLEKIDNILVIYDKVRGSVDEEVQKQKKQVASTLKVQEP